MKTRKKIMLLFFGAIGLSVTWFIVTQLRYSPTCDGIDVSHYNYITTKSSNVPSSYSAIGQSTFLIAKATEGTTIIDSKYNTHKQFARTKNLKFGAYHFLSKTSSAKDQFEHFKRVVGKDIDLVPCLDVERYNHSDWSLSQVRSYVKEWSELCMDYYGVYPIIYCTDLYRWVFFFDMPNQFWINNTLCKPLTKCVIHQFSHNDETLDYNHLMTDITDIMLR